MNRQNQLIAGTVAGLLGGIGSGLMATPSFGWSAHLFISAVLGLLFGLGFGFRVRTAGSGLMWGQAYGMLWWMVGTLSLFPLLYGEGLQWSVPAVQSNFDALLAQIIGFGSVLGIATHAVGRFLPGSAVIQTADEDTLTPPELVPPLIQALIVGSIGGLLGAWVFLRGMTPAIFLPQVATLLGANSMMVGGLLHYSIGVVIALTFAALFHREIGGVGPAIVWGMSYGLLWWIIGPLTLMPLLLGNGPDWTIEGAQLAFSSLVAHLLYGAVVGWFYALINRLWQTLFVDSDPLSRSREGSGVRSVRGILWGQIGGMVGGLLFSLTILGVGALPEIAGLVGSTSPVVGFLVHLLIAVVIGSSFGLLFEEEVTSYGVGMTWGILYGLLWWLLGALTLFPALLRQPMDWSLPTAVAAYPSLIGHLLYGIGLGLLFGLLTRRYRPALRDAENHSATSAMWASTLLFATMLPLLLAV